MAVHVCNHPFIQHHLTHMRDKRTEMTEFRQLLDRISALMAVEVTRNFELTSTSIETPMERMTAPILVEKQVTIVPILRAALGMINGLLSVLPQASLAHLGLERDEQTLLPRGYYRKVPPNLSEKEIIIVDPMLATGGSMLKAIEILQEAGGKVERMRLLSLVAAPEGLSKVQALYPDIPIYTAAIDERLNDIGYIVPGLGDAGDRLFGTI